MKWSRSNKMKESFNCITHPHSTSCGELSSSSAGMDIVMNRWRTMLLQMMCWMDHVGFISSSLPVQHSYKHCHPQIQISHTNSLHTLFTLQINLLTRRQSMSPYRQQSCTNWEFRCQLHTQRRAQIPTRAIHYLWHHKNKAHSEMPPRDFLEELIYSI